MDPRFLDADEIQIELDVRGQNVAHPQAVALLSDFIEAELAGLRAIPSKLHRQFRSINSEVAALQWKLSTIILTSGELDELLKGRSRLLHIHGRVLRILPDSKGNIQVSQLKLDVEDGIAAFNQLISDIDNRAQLLQQQLHPEEVSTDAEMVSPPNTTNREVAETGNPPSVSAPPNETGVETAAPLASSKLSTITSVPGLHETRAPPASQSIQPSIRPIPSNNPPIQQAAQPNSAPSGQVPPGRIHPVATGSLHPILPPSANPLSVASTYHPLHHSSNPQRVAEISPASHPYRFPELGFYSGHHAPLASAHHSISQPSYAQRVSEPGPPSAPHQRDLSHGWTMSKWPLRFSGGAMDLPIDEFLFRTETLARLSMIPQAALTLGLHQLLLGSAASWYWIFIRNHPNATWEQTRSAITRAFQACGSDAAIRRLIMD